MPPPIEEMVDLTNELASIRTSIIGTDQREREEILMSPSCGLIIFSLFAEYCHSTMNPRFFAGSRGLLFFFLFFFSSSSVLTLEAFEQHTCRSNASELSSLAYRQ